MEIVLRDCIKGLHGTGSESVILPCSHCYCIKCIQTKTQLVCPECQKIFSVVYDRDPEATCSTRIAWISGRIIEDGYFEEKATLLGVVPKVAPKVTQVMGMALVEDNLHVVYEKNANMYVYEADKLSKKDQFTGIRPKVFPVKGMEAPNGIGGSSTKKCVYVVDWRPTNRLLKLKAASGEVVKEFPMNMEPFAVSVSADDKVIVTGATILPHIPNMIFVYEDDDSILKEVHRIALDGDIAKPQFAIKLPDEMYLIANGFHLVNKHRVSLVSVDGAVQANYGKWKGGGPQSLDVPRSVYATTDGWILVVDCYNGRIHLLTKHLQLVRHLLTKDDGLKDPRHICMDKAGKLFVGLLSGEIQVFSVTKSKTT